MSGTPQHESLQWVSWCLWWAKLINVWFYWRFSLRFPCSKSNIRQNEHQNWMPSWPENGHHFDFYTFLHNIMYITSAFTGFLHWWHHYFLSPPSNLFAISLRARRQTLYWLSFNNIYVASMNVDVVKAPFESFPDTLFTAIRRHGKSRQHFQSRWNNNMIWWKQLYGHQPAEKQKNLSFDMFSRSTQITQCTFIILWKKKYFFFLFKWIK